MNTKSRTVVRPHQDDFPQRHLPLVDLLVDTRAELFELTISSGMRVLTTRLGLRHPDKRGARQRAQKPEVHVAAEASAPDEADSEGHGIRSTSDSIRTALLRSTCGSS